MEESTSDHGLESSGLDALLQLSQAAVSISGGGDDEKEEESINMGDSSTKQLSSASSSRDVEIGSIKGERPRKKIKSESESLPSWQVSSPFRVRMPAYKPGDLTAKPRPPAFVINTQVSPLGDIYLCATDDHPFNRRGFRYIPCEATLDLPNIMYRQTDIPPFGPRVNYEDMSMQALVDVSTGTIVSTDKGFRTARANVCAREGQWFWECRILRSAGANKENNHDGHIRIGWTRREASLEMPVGSDAYGYGVRDVTGQKMHISRGSEFMNEAFQTGDVIGLHISLPTIAEQLNDQPLSPKISNVVRDRFPIRYKNQLYFEQFECVPAKEFQDMLNQSSIDDPAAREKILKQKGLPNSYIKVYKNGKLVGTAFDSLLPFLPPHSKPLANLGGRTIDDGFLGYYPTISVFQGGAAQFNFGPDFDCFPSDLRNTNVRPMCDRYVEQIAEDVVWDVIDEAVFSVEATPVIEL
ncbi:hypothetical protein V1511DRAFT_505726 [Dipodascopsis uninucleata]